MTRMKMIVSGHDFSRAVKFRQVLAALAAEVRHAR